MHISREQNTNFLQQRMKENEAAQEIDLTQWIFDIVRVNPNARILELCCGTGGQTQQMVKYIDRGHITAIDISQKSLDVLYAKLKSTRGKVTPLCADMDNLSMGNEKYDLIFCAYGLYYSKNALRVLGKCKQYLKRNGKFVIVGPFGPNNKQLFDFLIECGVELPVKVMYTSRDFMFMEVLPWASENFSFLKLHVLVNRVKWYASSNFLNYWRNTTFYQPDKVAAVQGKLYAHLSAHPAFINDKWVMMMEATKGRI